ncbi:SDR family oxidoreductase [Flavobacterium sp. Fl-77]|uniref:SDR family oxidoreductase n=1 Tax=Flavobacterium flavipigmentatum TaxID=2893884 RepID=A0AAJ2SDY7_9FLAO|nr:MULTISPECIES: SDR family oxidoreductase [unclassified Flavobacterium]MDX6180788.1 SDR family oxidoreductase [Flavobacterium sp. Fl-33]MDX6184388.1 SDR family oxidoreductase [Flavobacterium sp. Fl-77]UFH39497.1 SDR family oxidoreductase [Flavobacterium sp. F-70]
MDTKKIWFVTGASKGLGLTLVKKLLLQGFSVAATSRDRKSLIKEIGEENENFLPIEMDLTKNDDVRNAIETTIGHFGRIDVLVNNAGYSQIGTLEELSEIEVERNFKVNVFGSLNVIRNASKYLRNQKSGHIFNISSIGGYTGNFAGFGIYCSTKFAVAGFTEALAEEMKPFGVHTTLVYPGYFRTNFLSEGSVQTPANPIEDYKSAREMEQAHLNQINGNQPNDPEKAAEIFITLSEQENPPVHFFMGEDAYHYAHLKIETIQKAMKEHQVLGTSSGFNN